MSEDKPIEAKRGKIICENCKDEDPGTVDYVAVEYADKVVVEFYCTKPKCQTKKHLRNAELISLGSKHIKDE